MRPGRPILTGASPKRRDKPRKTPVATLLNDPRGLAQSLQVLPVPSVGVPTKAIWKLLETIDESQYKEAASHMQKDHPRLKDAANYQIQDYLKSLAHYWAKRADPEGKNPDARVEAAKKAVAAALMPENQNLLVYYAANHIPVR